MTELRAAAGVSNVDVRVIGCPTLYVYDRTGESTKPPPGEAWFYLLRDDAEGDFGQDSDGTPRMPVEIGCS